MAGRAGGAETAPAKSERRQRLFFALWPDDTVREALARIGRATRCSAGTLVPAENLHLTLAFLGSMSGEQRGLAEQVASEVRGASFTLCFDRVGVWRRPQVLWCAPSQTPGALSRLVNDLTCRLGACGVLRTPTRPYRAHLTLARKVVSSVVAQTARPVTWRVRQFHLVASQTHPSGARYRVLSQWSLDV